MKRINYMNTRITGGFWKHRSDIMRTVTAESIYSRFTETGRIRAFDFDWKEGMPDKPDVFWDSDVAKWIEGAAYLCASGGEPELQKKIDALTDRIEANQRDDGYFNIYYTVVEPENRFRFREKHELYCAGHLIEAAVAYYQATGKRKLLDCMIKYADYIDCVFRLKRSAAFTTPGHEEIELALVRLYDCTGEKRYLDLAEFFIDMRGVSAEPLYKWCNRKYEQSDRPVRELTEATGHSVRAVYLFCGMADVAKRTGDAALAAACKRLFDNIVNRRMYITGGIGSSSAGEAFTLDYDLPNLLAYTETCAALGLALFAHRMLLIENDRRYADVIERVMYNGFLSGISLSGDSFFYENPLELIPELRERDESVTGSSLHLPVTRRKKVFECSCCPPNALRFIASIGNLLYTVSEDETTVFVHQFAQSQTRLTLRGADAVISQKTAYPDDGKIEISYRGKPVRLAVRIPGWCEEYNGETENGYAVFDVADGDTVTLNFPMKAVLIEANPLVSADTGRCALMRGPLVYCLEQSDNGRNLRDITIDAADVFTPGFDEALGVPTLTVNASRNAPRDALYGRYNGERIETTAKFIPYYAFANREEGEMLVWFSIK